VYERSRNNDELILMVCAFCSACALWGAELESAYCHLVEVGQNFFGSSLCLFSSVVTHEWQLDEQGQVLADQNNQFLQILACFEMLAHE